MLVDKVRAVLLLCFALLFFILSGSVYASLYQQPHASVLGVSSSNDIPSGLSVKLGNNITYRCTSFPCATGYISGSGEFHFGFGFFPSAVSSPQPQAFYPDVLEIEALVQPVNITSIVVSNVKTSSANDFGAITIYSCASQTNDPLDYCPMRLTVTSTLGGSELLNETVMPQQTMIIEVSGFAGENATPGGIISFDLSIS